MVKWYGYVLFKNLIEIVPNALYVIISYVPTLYLSALFINFNMTENPPNRPLDLQLASNTICLNLSRIMQALNKPRKK